MYLKCQLLVIIHKLGRSGLGNIGQRKSASLPCFNAFCIPSAYLLYTFYMPSICLLYAFYMSILCFLYSNSGLF